ncbi:hypothetical protein LCGC14_2135270 [marine sediment metagenome]|uniref:Uncharacterized protein n=1 Tax=marine sediment metagenome TaxID=412755 RepID=A0A0F9GWD0_9ZZZZ
MLHIGGYYKRVGLFCNRNNHPPKGESGWLLVIRKGWMQEGRLKGGKKKKTDTGPHSLLLRLTKSSGRAQGGIGGKPAKQTGG